MPSPEPGRAPESPGTPRRETFPVEVRTSHATWLGVGKGKAGSSHPGARARPRRECHLGEREWRRLGRRFGQASIGKVSLEGSLAALRGGGAHRPGEFITQCHLPS